VGVDERIILKGISRSVMGSIDWIDLAQQRYGWRALVNALMNIRVLYNASSFSTIRRPVSFSRRTLIRGDDQLFS
jgi:hypothetical protein